MLDSRWGWGVGGGGGCGLGRGEGGGGKGRRGGGLQDRTGRTYLFSLALSQAFGASLNSETLRSKPKALNRNPAQQTKPFRLRGFGFHTRTIHARLRGLGSYGRTRA